MKLVLCFKFISLFLTNFHVNGQQLLDCGENGLRNKRIVGGERAFIWDYPWIAELRETFNFINCGAAIIHKCFVLSSAHCFKMQTNQKVLVTFGTDSVKFNRTQARFAVKMIRHPKYDRTAHHDDIMLVKLDKPIKFTPNIQPICLPEHNEDFNATNAEVIGFGHVSYHGQSSSKLQSVNLDIIPNNICAQVFNTSLIKPTNICAGGEKGKDACQGDSGAPLLVKANMNYYVIGVVSWGYGCAQEGIPGVYTRISAYIDWIYDVIEHENC